MTDYLANLVSRTLNVKTTIRPRLPSRFEPLALPGVPLIKASYLLEEDIFNFSPQEIDDSVPSSRGLTKKIPDSSKPVANGTLAGPVIPGEAEEAARSTPSFSCSGPESKRPEIQSPLHCASQDDAGDKVFPEKALTQQTESSPKSAPFSIGGQLQPETGVPTSTGSMPVENERETSGTSPVVLPEKHEFVFQVSSGKTGEPFEGINAKRPLAMPRENVRSKSKEALGISNATRAVNDPSGIRNIECPGDIVESPGIPEEITRNYGQPLRARGANRANNETRSLQGPVFDEIPKHGEVVLRLRASPPRLHGDFSRLMDQEADKNWPFKDSHRGGYNLEEYSLSSGSDADKSIQVTIGKVEVRATPSQSATQKSNRTQPVMSLDEYLRQRSNGGSR